jgi:hypothetical protein
MQLIYTHEVIQQGLDEATQRLAVQANIYDTIGTKEVVQNSYEKLSSIDEDISMESIRRIVVEEVVDGLGSLLLENYFFDNIKENNLAPGVIVGGFDGIDFFDSKFLLEDDDIKGVIMYKAVPLFNWFGVLEFNVIQVSTCRAWTGYGVDEPEDEVVYKTKNGEVYHTKKTCSYINFEVSKTTYSRLSGKSPCKTCAEGKDFSEGDTVFVTRTGDRFHSSLECSRLKRVIIEIKKIEIGDLRPCSRCGKLEGE